MPAFFFRKHQEPVQPPRAGDPAVTCRSGFLDGVHLFVLATFGITEPVYDRLCDNPSYLEDVGFGITGTVLLVAVLSLVIPALPVIGLWVTGWIGPRTRFSFQAMAIYALLVVIALPIAKRFEVVIPDWSVIGIALAAAALAGWCYFAFRRARSVVSVAAIGIIAFPAWFLPNSPVGSALSKNGRLEFTSRNPLPVVMVVFDELCGLELMDEHRELDATRFPNFSALARSSNWFRNATTVFPETWQAVPVLLSGQFPRLGYTPRANDLPQNLFNILESTRTYEFAVFEPISRLASRHVQLSDGLPQTVTGQVGYVLPTLSRLFLQHLAPTDLRKMLPGVPALWFGIGQGRRVDRQARRGVLRYVWGDDRFGQFEHFLDCLDDSPRPTLYFSHVLLPHVPWCYLPTGRRYLPEVEQWELLDFDSHGTTWDFWGTDELYVTQSQQRHLLQVQFVDLLLGKLLTRLRETGLYDRCLLIVTADHGISFKANDRRRGITKENRADIMSIPLFIKTPFQQQGAVSDRNVESIDVLPTIASLLKIELSLPVDGRSVFDSQGEQPAKTICLDMSNRESVRATVLDEGTVVAELRERLGPSSEPEAMFRIGPHVELIGRSPDDLPATGGTAVEIELVRSATRYTRERDDVVPCYHEGRVISAFPHDHPVYIAVAVNGVIRSVTRTFLLDGVRDQFAAMVPESSLRPGENDVKFYAVTGESPNLHLQECVIKNADDRSSGHQ